MNFFSDKRIVVTGGGGFLGSFVVEKLRERGCRDIFVPRSREYDLVDMEAVKRLYRDAKPDIVIHLAARVGGIGANRANAGKFLRQRNDGNPAHRAGQALRTGEVRRAWNGL